MFNSSTWFREWFNSPYYHKLYFEHDEKEAFAFISRLLNTLGPPENAKLLDVACGRGRHSKLLAAKGFDVTGIDLAPASIAIAQAQENGHLHFYEHDMRLPFWINYFDYAFNFFTSFGYFRTEREHYNAIRTISNALKPKGIVVIDYLNVHYAEDHLVHKHEKVIDDVRYYLTKWYDETHFYKKIEIEDERLEAPLEYTERVAKFSLGDFNDMFAFYGLQLKEVYGDYLLNPYDIKNSPRMIMFAQKTN
ncbi:MULTISPECIES: class I SAM-dependent methyltransferase [Niastella]|uniref:Class I SAM-dependent methyltransferase n=1 Tax=Niastella soli TaxID=2821487 RepID=A0ABS3YTB1_9BACT|nr:class I SAM-dependent methyltransferase [Niastella soli]MBO9201110.1 class I SAM-dependent methyltransferase [Niastella soli]